MPLAVGRDMLPSTVPPPDRARWHIDVFVNSMSHDPVHEVFVKADLVKGLLSRCSRAGKQARIQSHDHQQLRIPMDIKATIGQLTGERDKLDKAIQALQSLEDSSGPAPRATASRAT